MDITNIKMLPDRVEAGTLLLLFRGVLEEFEHGKLNKKEFLICLSDLTDRQIWTYGLLEQDTRNDVDKVVRALWNLDSYDDVDIILSIVVNLGLSQSFMKIKKSLHTKQDIDPRIRKEIEETVVEVGEHISNPYHDLERFK
ncbi:hypothetical protein [Paenibacillus sp. FSL R7-0652]|uniref:hypothetical protein n=1 Tax=Paenibacillus sp. FSL R7-0652 TaxID=2921687 RepID=UPI003159D433